MPAIKTIQHPEKVPKLQEKIILNYRFEEVVGYGKNPAIQINLIYSIYSRLLGQSEKGLGSHGPPTSCN